MTLRSLIRRLEEATHPFKGMVKQWAQGRPTSDAVITAWYEYQQDPRDGVPQDEWPARVAEWRYSDFHTGKTRVLALADADASNQQVIAALERTSAWADARSYVEDQADRNVGVVIYRHAWQKR